MLNLTCWSAAVVKRHLSKEFAETSIIVDMTASQAAASESAAQKSHGWNQ